MLDRLVVDLGESIQNVEIIISNNCSTDETDDVILNWLQVNSDLIDINYLKQPENIGVSKNIMLLLYKARAEYFMFMGDDDKLNQEKIGDVIRILKNQQPVALIQTVISGRINGSKAKSGVMDFYQASKYFYEYGNAWAGIIRTKDARYALDSRNLRREVEGIVWPQTVAGFLAINDSSDLAYGVDFEIGSQLEGSLNITNKDYWIRSFFDLLKAIKIIETYTDKNIHKSFISIRTLGFVAHVKAIAISSLTSEKNASTQKLREFMMNNFGLRGFFWSVFLLASDSNRLMFLISIPMFGMRGKWAGKALRLYREKRKERILSQEKKVKRYGDWF